MIDSRPPARSFGVVARKSSVAEPRRDKVLLNGRRAPDALAPAYRRNDTLRIAFQRYLVDHDQHSRRPVDVVADQAANTIALTKAVAATETSLTSAAFTYAVQNGKRRNRLQGPVTSTRGGSPQRNRAAARHKTHRGFAVR